MHSLINRASARRRGFQKAVRLAVPALLSLAPGLALAEAAHGPRDGAVGMLPAASRLAEDVHFFHNGVLMPIITAISVFVLALLIWVIVRYNAKANPNPQKFSHNTLVEVVWTGVPILILLVIALFSFDLLYKEDVIPDGRQAVIDGDGATTTFAFENDFPAADRRVVQPSHIQVFLRSATGELRRLPKGAYDLSGLGQDVVEVTLSDAPSSGEQVVIRGGRSASGRGDRREIALAPGLTLKVNGYQWGWSYSYPDFGDFEFASNMLPADQTSPALYRFEVDNRVVVPVGETVRVTTTARDVIHSWAMPNFALKIDAVPGRINETWFKADEEGVYYGQCSEICGIKHSFMPIAIEVVSRDAFERWVDEQRALAGLEPMFDDAARFAQAVASQN